MRPSRQADRWFDPLLAVALLLAAEVELLVGPRNGPLLVEVAVVAATTAPLAWRRRAPIAVACVVMTMLVVLRAIYGDFDKLTYPLLPVLIAPYTVAAYEPRNRALLGLAACTSGVFAVHAVRSDEGSLGFIIGMVGASWAAGRVLRGRRIQTAQLTEEAKRIAAEREDRELLAVAEERSRIARELHSVVATAVSAMVVQTEAAQRLLDVDPARADQMMESIEEAGRRTLTEMRRVLGVLREDHEAPELSPQPGVGQIHALIDAARRDRQQIELNVSGEPGSLPASVNLGLYRILEDALTTAGESTDHPTTVELSFDEDGVELTVTSSALASLSWPTPAMRERVALCEGQIEVDSTASAAERLSVRLPRTFAGALV